MAAEQGFCSKCGSALTPGSSFCPRCGAPVFARAQTTPPPPYMGRREKAEKQEKSEKKEKQEKSGGTLGGALVGGSILIWLGISFYLQSIGYLSWQNWWAYFLLGLGVILIADGLVGSLQRNPGFVGMVIGGGVLAFIGAASILSTWQYLWPLFLVLLGIAVIVGGITARRRSPTPKAS